MRKPRLGSTTSGWPPTKAQTNKAFDGFLQTYEAKYPKVADCLRKDREAFLAFYQFPAEHWQHI